MRSTKIVKANLKRHAGSLSGLFILMLIATISLAVVLTVWINSRSYVYEEMDRLAYGDLTVWVSNSDDIDQLLQEAEALDEIESADKQDIVIANYELHAHESDSEGQLISYSPDEYAYRFFTDDLSSYREAPEAINPGEAYVPASFISMFDAAIGDVIHVVVARNGITRSLTIKGFFEDPFMGSTMIGMKSFLVNPEDNDSILAESLETEINSLARGGAMIHIKQTSESGLTAAELNSLLNQKTSFLRYTEFVHSREVLAGFMLILQNIFAGLLLAFVIILLLSVFIVLGHGIGNTMEQDAANLGILKTVGYSGSQLRYYQIIQFLFPLVIACISGLILSPLLSRILNHMTLTSTGILVPSDLPVAVSLSLFLVILALAALFIYLKTSAVTELSPLSAIQREKTVYAGRVRISIKPSWLLFRMSLRQLYSGRKNYISSFFIALLLVFSVSLIGRLNSWLGPDGEGLMDAFNPAELDLGVQIFSDLPREEVESVISNLSPIVDVYELAMPNISLNGVDYTSNVITDPDRLHILKGNTCSNENEVVLTEFLASDLGVSIGDMVILSADSGSERFVITGFYQCANDMGSNLALNREGYLRIAHGSSRIWCVHYFLEDPEKRFEVMETLEELYRADIHVHENGWPGLYGIIGAMHSLMIYMYVIAAVVIFTAVYLSGTKILDKEQHDLSIYRVSGFSIRSLRISFSLRFLLVSTAGSFIGLIMSLFLSDPLVDKIMRFAGISGFSASPELFTVFFPAFVIIILFSVFAFLVSDRIRKSELNSLVAE